jgi:hypothetical protein
LSLISGFKPAEQPDEAANSFTQKFLALPSTGFISSIFCERKIANKRKIVI